MGLGYARFDEVITVIQGTPFVVDLGAQRTMQHDGTDVLRRGRSAAGRNPCPLQRNRCTTAIGTGQWRTGHRFGHAVLDKLYDPGVGVFISLILEHLGFQGAFGFRRHPGLPGAFDKAQGHAQYHGNDQDGNGDFFAFIGLGFKY